MDATEVSTTEMHEQVRLAAVESSQWPILRELAKRSRESLTRRFAGRLCDGEAAGGLLTQA
jgi:hypothetical protein